MSACARFVRSLEFIAEDYRGKTVGRKKLMAKHVIKKLRRREDTRMVNEK